MVNNNTNNRLIAKKNKNRPQARRGRDQGAVTASNTRAGRRRNRARIPAGNVVSINTHAGRRVPRTYMSNGSTVVSHVETYGINVTGSSDFSVFGTWALQPALSTYSRGLPLGSWLPQIATNFDNYEILDLKFAYRAACSTLEPGLIAFGYDPNPEGSTPTSYQELRNMLSIDGSVHANATFDIASKARKSIQRELLTRKGAVVNLPSYDAGKVFFGTIGCTEGAKLGFIDVHYKIRLSNPQSDKSTTIPYTVYTPQRPVYRFVALPSADASCNASASCFQVFETIRTNGTASGATDMFTAVNSVPGIDVTIQGGCKFTSTAQSTWRGWTAVYPGRYKVKIGVAADFRDLRLFAAIPFVRPANGSSATRIGNYSVLLNTNGADSGKIDNIAHVHRGFTGVTSLDPDPGTDMGLYASWDVDLEAGDTLLPAVGIRTYNNVSLNDSTVIFRGGLGPSYLLVEFLGPIAD